MRFSSARSLTCLFALSSLSAFACSNGPGPTSPCTNCETGGTGTGSSASGGSSGGSPSGGTGGSVDCPAPGSGGTAPDIDVPLDTATNASVNEEIRTNHLGYLTAGAKRAVVQANGELTSFQVVRTSDQKVRFAGTLTEAADFTAFGGSDRHFVADFTTLREEGSFVLRVNGHDSPAFAIAADLYGDETLADLVSYFHSSRADDAAVWSADENVSRVGGGDSENVQGGWYDASGDISKYLSHLSYANHLNPQQIPLVAFALAYAGENAGARLDGLGLGTSVRAEALYGADYLVRVQADEGYFFTTVFDNWTGDLGAREICAFEGEAGTKTSEYSAAFREGGGMAIAALARISTWNQSGSFTSAEYLEAARTGYAHLATHNTEYADDGQENVIDDYTALLAASELYAATNEEPFLTGARSRAASLTARLASAGYFTSRGTRPFWHASDAGLPVLSLVRYAELETDTAAKTAALDAVATHLDYLVEVTGKVPNPYGYARQHVNTGATVFESFFVPHDNETGYWWQGENARLASLATAAFVGARAVSRGRGCSGEVSDDLNRFAQDQLDWILGKNPRDISFLAGTGRNNPPSYCSEKAPYHGHLTGGISNGITGSETNGGGLQWLSGAPQEECWRDWRWVEQWLPHSAWFLLAVTASVDETN